MELGEVSLLARLVGCLHQIEDEGVAGCARGVAAAQALGSAFGAEQRQVTHAPPSLLRERSLRVRLPQSLELEHPAALTFVGVHAGGLFTAPALERLFSSDLLGRALGCVALSIVCTHRAALFGSVPEEPRHALFRHGTATSNPAAPYAALRLELELAAHLELFAAIGELPAEARLRRITPGDAGEAGA